MLAAAAGQVAIKQKSNATHFDYILLIYIFVTCIIY